MKTTILFILFLAFCMVLLSGCDIYITIGGEITAHIEEENVGEIIGRVLADHDNDGIYDGLEGEPVFLKQLEAGLNPLSEYTTIDQTETMKGLYSFHQVPVGTYSIYSAGLRTVVSVTKQEVAVADDILL